VLEGGYFSGDEDSSQEEVRLLERLKQKPTEPLNDEKSESAPKVEMQRVAPFSSKNMDLSLFGIKPGTATKKKPKPKPKKKKKRPRAAPVNGTVAVVPVNNTKEKKEPPRVRAKKKSKVRETQNDSPAQLISKTMASFVKICVYEAFFAAKVWKAPPDEAKDSPALIAEKKIIQKLIADANAFSEALETHAARFYLAVREHALTAVGGAENHPLIVFYDQLVNHSELHVEQARKPPVTTKSNQVRDVWTGEVHDINNPLTHGTTKRKSSTSKLLTLVPREGEDCLSPDSKPFSVVCNQRGAAMLVLVHEVIHFRGYINAVVRKKCEPLKGCKKRFGDIWDDLVGKHADKPCDKWAWSSKKPFVKPLVSLYKQLSISFNVTQVLGVAPVDGH